MFYATRMRDARGSYFNLLNGYAQLGRGTVNSAGLGITPLRKGASTSIRSTVLPKERSLLGNLIAVLPKGDTPGFGLAKFFVGVDVDEDGGPSATAFRRGGLL